MRDPAAGGISCSAACGVFAPNATIEVLVVMRKTGRQGSRSSWLYALAKFGVRDAQQLRTKSDQWFGDVRFLHENERWSAAVYLGGFVIECLLKSALWSRRSQPRVGALIGGSHDLGVLLRLHAGLRHEIELPVNARVLAGVGFLSSWSVSIRYNPRRPTADEARDFWQRLGEVRSWLVTRI